MAQAIFRRTRWVWDAAGFTDTDLSFLNSIKLT
jgi:hypothetical protein